MKVLEIMPDNATVKKNYAIKTTQRIEQNK